MRSSPPAGRLGTGFWSLRSWKSSCSAPTPVMASRSLVSDTSAIGATALLPEDKSHDQEYGGAGLGTFSGVEIADLHGGSVWVEKSSEKGTFSLRWSFRTQSTKPCQTLYSFRQPPSPASVAQIILSTSFRRMSFFQDSNSFFFRLLAYFQCSAKIGRFSGNLPRIAFHPSHHRLPAGKWNQMPPNTS